MPDDVPDEVQAAAEQLNCWPLQNAINCLEDMLPLAGQDLECACGRP